jgi:hypothetical protein
MGMDRQGLEPRLPERVKRAVLAMVKAATSSGE